MIQLNYERSFGQGHNLTAFVAYEQLEGFSTNISAYRRDLISQETKVELFAASTDQMRSDGLSWTEPPQQQSNAQLLPTVCRPCVSAVGTKCDRESRLSTKSSA